jgi:hypothetical protein
MGQRCAVIENSSLGAPCQGAEKGTSIDGGRSKSSAWSPRHFCDGDRLCFFVRRGAMALVLRRSLRDVQVPGVGASRGHGEDALGGPRFHASTPSPAGLRHKIFWCIVGCRAFSAPLGPQVRCRRCVPGTGRSMRDQDSNRTRMIPC